jgi:beta-barrel assembly-enhancing protease
MRVLGGSGVRGIAASCMLLLLATLGCSVSEDQEVELGRRNAEQVDAQLPILRDAIASNYVQALGASIAGTTSRADLQWQFRIIDSREINAFALPGGYIYVNRGLIERAERLDELAGALAHEVGHVVLRHSVHQIEKQTKTGVAVELGCRLTNICNSDVARAAIQVGGAALFARYSRHDEAEADSEAVQLVVDAGIDPTGIPALFRRLLEERRTSPARFEVFFASHPLEEDRIVATEREIAAIAPSALQGLRQDDPSYQAFKAHLARLPRAPEREPGPIGP